MKTNPTQKPHIIGWTFLITAILFFAASSMTLAADLYEDDNNPNRASVIVLNDTLPQTHNFHAPGDEDWVKFYALKDVIYEIKASNLEPYADVVLELYDTDGTTMLLRRNDGHYAEDELISYKAPETKIYYLKAKQADPNIFGEGTQYNLEVYRPVEGSGYVEYVYVADTENHRIQKFNAIGQFVAQWGSYGGGAGQFNLPWGIALDEGSGYVYVADTENHRIQKFNAIGQFVAQWGSYGSGAGQFVNPSGIAIDGSGYVYVADTYNHRIQKFNANGQFVAQWGSGGSGAGQFVNPRSIAIDGSGYVYVADTYNHRIQKFNASGQFVAQWGSYGGGAGQFVNPSGIAIDGSGYVYVADTENHRIQKFNVNGQFVDLWASGGVNPYGIAIDGSGYVYVADTYNHRIQIFDANGQCVAQWGSWGSGAGQFVYPHGIAAPHISIPPPGPDIGTIQGIVYSDMSYALITAATVQAGLGSAIVQNGVFTMKVNAGMWDLQVSSGDYGNKTLPEVIVMAGEVTDVSILMSYSIAGDINGDGNINIADAILALQVISGVYLSPAVIIHKEAHLNGDGKIGMEEVIYILQKVAGMR